MSTLQTEKARNLYAIRLFSELVWEFSLRSGHLKYLGNELSQCCLSVTCALMAAPALSNTAPAEPAPVRASAAQFLCQCISVQWRAGHGTE